MRGPTLLIAALTLATVPAQAEVPAPVLSCSAVPLHAVMLSLPLTGAGSATPSGAASCSAGQLDFSCAAASAHIATIF